MENRAPIFDKTAGWTAPALAARRLIVTLRRRDRPEALAAEVPGDLGGLSRRLLDFLRDMRLDDASWVRDAQSLVRDCRAGSVCLTGATEQALGRYASGLDIIDAGLRRRREDVVDRGIEMVGAALHALR